MLGRITITALLCVPTLVIGCAIERTGDPTLTEVEGEYEGCDPGDPATCDGLCFRHMPHDDQPANACVQACDPLSSGACDPGYECRWIEYTDGYWCLDARPYQPTTTECRGFSDACPSGWTCDMKDSLCRQFCTQTADCASGEYCEPLAEAGPGWCKRLPLCSSVICVGEIWDAACESEADAQHANNECWHDGQACTQYSCPAGDCVDGACIPWEGQSCGNDGAGTCIDTSSGASCADGSEAQSGLGCPGPAPFKCCVGGTITDPNAECTDGEVEVQESPCSHRVCNGGTWGSWNPIC